MSSVGNLSSSLSLLVMGAIASMMLCSCVHEDRSTCPSYLILNLSDEAMTAGKPLFDNVKGSDSVKVWVKSSYGTHEMNLAKDDFPYTLAVGKGKVTAWCLAAVEDLDYTVFPLGEECPRLWLFCAQTSAWGDAVEMTLVPRKSWCCLNVTFLRTDEEFACRLRGEIDGYERIIVPPAWSPHEGDFMFETSGYVFDVRLPRQRDASLVLDVLGDENLQRSFALGEYILASGYDWSAPTLDDISIAIDLAIHELTVSTSTFSRTFVYDLLL